MGPYQICRLPAMRPPSGSPFPSTAPAAPQVRRIGMHGGEGGLAPAAEEQSRLRSPPAPRDSHDILPGPGSTPGARHHAPGGTGGRRVGMSQRRRDSTHAVEVRLETQTRRAARLRGTLFWRVSCQVDVTGLTVIYPPRTT